MGLSGTIMNYTGVSQSAMVNPQVSQTLQFLGIHYPSIYNIKLAISLVIDRLHPL